MARKIEVTLKFSERDLNRLLEEVGFEGIPPVRKLTDAQFELLNREMQKSAKAFVEEIILGSYEAAANDWLYKFLKQFKEKG